jgi:hypothetical protein
MSCVFFVFCLTFSGLLTKLCLLSSILCLLSLFCVFCLNFAFDRSKHSAYHWIVSGKQLAYQRLSLVFLESNLLTIVCLLVSNLLTSVCLLSDLFAIIHSPRLLSLVQVYCSICICVFCFYNNGINTLDTTFPLPLL